MKFLLVLSLSVGCVQSLDAQLVQQNPVFHNLMETLVAQPEFDSLLRVLLNCKADVHFPIAILISNGVAYDVYKGWIGKSGNKVFYGLAEELFHRGYKSSGCYGFVISVEGDLTSSVTLLLELKDGPPIKFKTKYVFQRLGNGGELLE